MGLELAEVSGDVIEFFRILSILDLCENFVSGFLSLRVFCCNLSKAHIDLRVGSQGL